MFVTSSTHSPSTFGSDLSGADAICAARAAEAHLPGSYVAFLSTSTTSARQRLGSSRGWVRTDGTPLVDRIDDLLGGNLIYTPGVDEQGATTRGSVATGTNGDGSLNNGANCGDYTSTAGQTMFGAADSASATWTSLGVDLCTLNYRLYCFGVGRTDPVTFTPATGRKAFVTVQLFTAGGGISAADALCASEASAGGLSGTFSAVLAQNSASASSRFDLTGPPWVRVDGVALATTPLAFMAGNLLAPLNVTAVGSFTGGYVWTGGSFSAPANPPDNCGDWGSIGGTGTVGAAEYADNIAESGSTGIGCASPERLYCLQQ